MAVNEWDTDPYGDPTQQAGSPWLTSNPDTAAPAAPAPTAAPASGGWTEQNPWADNGMSSPTTPGAQTSAPASSPSTYDAHLSNISQATDPASHAAATDGLARQLQSDLEADGHEVRWTGATTLSIDGRDYEMGGDGQTTQPVPGNPRSAAPDASTSVGAGIPWLPGADHPSSSPDGFHWDPTLANFVPNAPTTTSTSGAGGRLDDAAILAQIAQWAKMDGADPSLANDPTYWLNAIKSRGGLGDDNRQFWQDAGVGPSAFFRNPGREKGPAGDPNEKNKVEDGGGFKVGQPGTGPTTNTNPLPGWSPTAVGYLPDFIDQSASELPGYDDIMAALSGPNAGDAELQKLVQGIVEHPETLTNEDIERLKAKSAEEAAVAGQANDEELQHYGYASGLDSSPWLAGQRAQNAWNRSSSTIQANRNIDISAAGTRQADRTNAAQIGTAFSSFQSSRKAQAVGIAVQAALGKSGEQRNRKALNESLKQAATQLGLSKDQLVMTYINHAMDDLTKNKSIDLNFDIDMKKLQAQSDEFKQTLLQRLAEMHQADDQFKANYGLAVQEFQHKKDTDAWDRAKSAGN